MRIVYEFQTQIGKGAHLDFPGAYVCGPIKKDTQLRVFFHGTISCNASVTHDILPYCVLDALGPP
jgi:hypothetical protein